MEVKHMSIKQDNILMNEQDKELAAQFLQSSIGIIKYDFDKLYKDITVIAPRINFAGLKAAMKEISDNKPDNYHKLNTEYYSEKDERFKKATIIIEIEQIIIESCRNIANSYFLAESVSYSLAKDEAFYTRTLLKTNYPDDQEFIQLATRTVHYNCEGVSDKCFREITSENYTAINNCQVDEQRKKHYMRCLTNNHNSKK